MSSAASGRDEDAVTAPAIRVEDAHLAAHGGPILIVISGAQDRELAAVRRVATAVLDEVVSPRRLRVSLLLERLADAAGGEPDLEVIAGAVQRAVDAWRYVARDLPTPAGTLRFGPRPVVMGVLNVTPDSFANGGVAYDPDDHPGRALRVAEQLLAEGADVIDVGGESTRPGADPVDEDEELARVVPVVRELARAGAIVSIDTVKAGVARAAIDAGAAIVNDISAGRSDAGLLPSVAAAGVPYVLMHMQGTPQTMQRDPRYLDVVAEVFEQLAADRGRAIAHGIDGASIVVDPGIGFGKTLAHNTALLGAARQFTSLGAPVLIGTSRKSFIGRLTGDDDPADRLEGSLATVALAVADNAAMLRVHDVAATRRTVEVARAVAAERSTGARSIRERPAER